MPAKQRPDTGRAAALLKALAHGLRFRIMIVLTEREASPTELAEILGEPLKKVCEHVKSLERDGFIELVDTDIRRGGVQHIFRAVARPIVSTEQTETLPLPQREAISAAISQSMIMDLLRATEAGSMDSRSDRVLIRMPLILDEEGFEEADQASIRHMEELHEIEARCAERRRRGDPGINATSAISVFPLPERPV